MNTPRNLLFSLGIFCSGAASAMTVTPFGVDPSAIGKPEGSFTASYVDFSYQATVDQQAGAGDTASFQQDGIGFFSSFQHPDLGNPVLGTGLNSSYRLYIRFAGEGTTVANGGGIDGSLSHFSAQIYADVNQDTAFTLPGVGAGDGDGDLALSGDGDDILVAHSVNLLESQFRVFAGLANGDFDIVMAMVSDDADAATPGDQRFFTDPFNLVATLRVDLNGVNTTLNGFFAPPAAFTDAQITGSGNLSAMPIPSALALMGIGLLGLVRKQF